MVSCERTVTAPETEVPEERDDEDERVPKGIHVNLQADAEVHHRGLRGRSQGRQQEEKQGRSNCAS